MPHALPRLHAEPSCQHTRRWLRRVIGLIGPGFHPDTLAAEYVDDAGTPLFSTRTARLLTYDLARAEHLLTPRRYEEICLAAIQQLPGIRPASNT